MQYTEFWSRMESALGASYARTWAATFVLAGLGGRTVEESLAAGTAPKDVWCAVWQTLELPARDR